MSFQSSKTKLICFSNIISLCYVFCFLLLDFGDSWDENMGDKRNHTIREHSV